MRPGSPTCTGRWVTPPVPVEVLELLRDRVTHPAGRLFVDGVATMTDDVGGSAGGGRHAVRTGAGRSGRSAPKRSSARSVGGTFALALMGRLDRVAEVAARGDDVQRPREGF